MTVYDNRLRLRQRDIGQADIDQRVRRAEKLDLAQLLTRKPHALSGGRAASRLAGRSFMIPGVPVRRAAVNLDAALRVTTRNEG
jgi:ABC-type sugar transport system ATPase subunit